MRALKHLAVPLLAFGLLVAALVVVVSRRPAGDAERPRATFERKTRAHLDHAAYFKEPFADGPSVTRACLSCHKDAAHQVMQTAHWSWLAAVALAPAPRPTWQLPHRSPSRRAAAGHLQPQHSSMKAASWSSRCAS